MLRFLIFILFLSSAHSNSFNDADFDGTLTSEQLILWGYDPQATSINLDNKNIRDHQYTNFR